jgi:dTMP kinase
LVFVIIDGLDASGKSTQAIRIGEILRNRGDSVCLRFHPSDDNLLGIETKKFLCSRGKNAHFAAALFYMLDVVRSILLYSWRKYDYVIFVRYLMGTSYLPYPLFIIAYDFFATIVPKSDFMFFLDVKPEEAHRRIQQTRKRREMFENMEKLKLIRQKALFLALRGKWTIINADRCIRDVEKKILMSLSR